jgi:hypothetical protein
MVPVDLHVHVCFETAIADLRICGFADCGFSNLDSSQDSRKVTKFSTLIIVLEYCTYVRDRLLPTSSNFGQHPPFFSKMRTFFKNRPRWF